MDMRKVIAAATIVLLMALALFNAASNVLNSAGGNISEKGGEKTGEAGCVFSNPSEGESCLEDSSLDRGSKTKLKQLERI